MSTTITDGLRGEHAVLYRLLDACAAGAARWSLEECKAAATAMAAALEPHARLEDELLFSALEEVLPFAGPLVVMRGEHDEVEGTLGRLRVAESATEARGLFRHLAGVARDHFAKEEQVLFVLAEEHLPGPRLEELGARWARESGVALSTGAGAPC